MRYGIFILLSLLLCTNHGILNTSYAKVGVVVTIIVTISTLHRAPLSSYAMIDNDSYEALSLAVMVCSIPSYGTTFDCNDVYQKRLTMVSEIIDIVFLKRCFPVYRGGGVRRCSGTILL